LTDTRLADLNDVTKGWTSVSLGWCAERTPRTPQFVRRCQQLTDTGLVNVICSMPALVELNLFGCTNVSDLSVTVLAEHCPQLTCALDRFF